MGFCIYTVMTCTKLEMANRRPTLGSARLVGFFTTLNKAAVAVEYNHGDIWEGCYDYAIIEKIEEGLYGTTHERWFYMYIKTAGKYVRIEEPEGFKHFCGFGIG